jgi:hypothetical protein
MWRFRSRTVVALLAGLVVAAAGVAFFLLRGDGAPASDGESARFESWNPVTPSSSYRVVIRHVKRGPTPPAQAAGGEISMLPPADALRTIVIAVDADCEATATVTVTDNATGIAWYETRTTREGDVVEFFPRPGIIVTDENRFLELGAPPGPGLDAIECGKEYAGPAGGWGQRISELGAAPVGSADYLSEPVSRYELTAPVDDQDRASLRAVFGDRADDFHDAVETRSVWLVHEEAGFVVSTALFVVFEDGHEELLDSEEILESAVTEPQWRPAGPVTVTEGNAS